MSDDVVAATASTTSDRAPVSAGVQAPQADRESNPHAVTPSSGRISMR